MSERLLLDLLLWIWALRLRWLGSRYRRDSDINQIDSLDWFKSEG